MNNGGDVTNDAFAFVGARVSTPHLAEDDLPWWTATDLRLHLYRPLAALSHRLDWALWPSVPALMHLHSLVWYGLLVLLVRAMHRGASDTDAGARRATLATLVFALSRTLQGVSGTASKHKPPRALLTRTNNSRAPSKPRLANISL